MTRNIFVTLPTANQTYSESILTNSVFEQLRILLVLFVCILRLFLIRPYIQAHLNTSLTLAETFMDCTVRKLLLDLRNRVRHLTRACIILTNH